MLPQESSSSDQVSEEFIINNDESNIKKQSVEGIPYQKVSKEEKLKKRKEKWENKKEKFKKNKKNKKEVKQEHKKKESDEFFNKMRSDLSPEEFEKLMEENKKKKEMRIQEQRQQKEEMQNKLKLIVEKGITNDSNVCINLDCSFNDKMTDGELVSLSQQIGKCYAAYRKMESPFYFSITSFEGQIEEGLRKFEGFPDKWFMKYTQTHFTQVYEQQLKENKVVYLSADAEEEITDFQNGYVYIIGGIIDKNRHKNLCNKLAKEEYKIPTAKFPLEKHIDMKAATVLTTNQCVEIIAHVVHLKKDTSLSNDDVWKQALQKIIPMRKRKT